ncbi:MAG: hypothetical protein AAB969_00570 [Patescibacteria group bacterium]
MQLAHDLLWAIGFGLMIMSIGYTIRLHKEKDDNSQFKIPLDTLITFIIGIVMYFISFYIPIIR